MLPDVIDDLRRQLFAYGDDPAVPRMLALLQAGSAAFERSRFEPGHFTASAFVLSPEAGSLLLIHHAKLDRWLQPGGHIDPEDDTPLTGALREVREETGIADATGDGKLLDLDIHPIPANPKKGEPPHEHFDLRYLLQARSLDAKAGDDALAAKWVPLEEVAASGDDASVRRVASRLLKDRTDGELLP